MRVATLLIWSSVAIASATELELAGDPVRIDTSTAGQALRFELPDSVDAPVKVRATVTKRDGTRVELPSIAVVPPQPPQSRVSEGPVLPADCGGGKLILEVIDEESGQLIDKAASPIGF